MKYLFSEPDFGIVSGSMVEHMLTHAYSQKSLKPQGTPLQHLLSSVLPTGFTLATDTKPSKLSVVLFYLAPSHPLGIAATVLPSAATKSLYNVKQS